MAELATLARPYANAAFDIAKDAGELDRWSRMLAVLAAATRDERMQRLLAAPDVEEVQKAFRLSDVCGDELNEPGRKFVQVLARNKRLPLLSEIQALFEVLRAREQLTLDVEVSSAFELSSAEFERLKAALQSRFDKEISMTSTVDVGLIGGAIIRAGDTVIDGSVRGKLAKLAESVQRS
ncbi:MAG: F0F1 ATP synthase subunit delta [Pseudomonadales bacterium]